MLLQTSHAAGGTPRGPSFDRASRVEDHPGSAIEQLIGVFPLSWHGLWIPFRQGVSLVSGSPSNPAWLSPPAVRRRGRELAPSSKRLSGEEPGCGRSPSAASLRCPRSSQRQSLPELEGKSEGSVRVRTMRKGICLGTPGIDKRPRRLVNSRAESCATGRSFERNDYGESSV